MIPSREHLLVLAITVLLVLLVAQHTLERGDDAECDVDRLSNRTTQLEWAVFGDPSQPAPPPMEEAC